ncbi:MAG: transmembrane sensor [Cryomorphaceae bacterium]|jgi:transmembrane sensor
MNTLSFPLKEQVEANAAGWIAAIDRGISPSEEDQLNEWLNESPVHGEVLLKTASMWDLLDVLEPISRLLPLEDQPNSNHMAPDQQFYANASRGKAFAIAASLVLSISAALYLAEPYSVGIDAPIVNSAVSTTSAESPLAESQGRVYKTAVGEISNVSLADGSTLKLNTDSEVLVNFSATQRDITLLKGEVFFEVAKNPSKPFVVAVGEDRITAIGTAFCVDLSMPEAIEVLVTEGQVRVNREVSELSSSTQRSPYKEVFLTPGQKVVISDNTSFVSHDQNPDSMLAWLEGMVLFEGETLEQAIREIDRYTPLSFKIIDQEIASIPVGGYFRAGDLDQLLSVLEQNFGVSSYRLGEEVLLSKAVRR